MKSSRDTSGTHTEALTWFGAAVMTLSLVSYAFQSIYRGLDSVFNGQVTAPSGGVGLILAALVGFGLVLIGVGWNYLNRSHVGHGAHAADDHAPDKTIAA